MSFRSPVRDPQKSPPSVIVADIQKDESEVLEIYRKAKMMGYADITITVQEGARVKLWLTEKMK